MLRNEQKIGSRLDHLKQGFSGIFQGVLWEFWGVQGSFDTLESVDPKDIGQNGYDDKLNYFTKLKI